VPLVTVLSDVLSAREVLPIHLRVNLSCAAHSLETGDRGCSVVLEEEGRGRAGGRDVEVEVGRQGMRDEDQGSGRASLPVLPVRVVQRQAKPGHAAPHE
jgi:hypothetical protein